MPLPGLAVAEVWIGLIGALGGVALTGLLGVATAVLNNRWSEDQKGQEFRRRQAELRRDAYARYLVSAQVLGDALLLFTPGSAATSNDVWADFRRSEPSIAREFDASLRHARLLASDEVVSALSAYQRWFEESLGIAFAKWDQARIPLRDSGAFDDWDRAEARLIEVMRTEQRADLAARRFDASDPWPAGLRSHRSTHVSRP